MKLCNIEGGYTRPLVTNTLQLGALELRMRLEQLSGNCVCQRRPAYVLQHTFQHLTKTFCYINSWSDERENNPYHDPEC